MGKKTPEPQETESRVAFTLDLLGRPRLSLCGDNLTARIKYRKGIALLGYLAAHPGTWFSRETLADLLWPDLEPGPARTNLRQVLNNLSTVLNRSRDILAKDGDAVSFMAGDDIAIDLDLLSDAALDAAVADTPGARLRRERDIEPRTAGLCGEFMAGLQLAGTPDFDHWLEAQRLRVRERTVLLLEKLCRSQHHEGRLGAATRTARDLLALSPLGENHVLLLMSLLAEAGDTGSALDAYAAYARRLAEDLASEPGPAIRALRDELGQAHSGARQEAELRQLVALYCLSPQLESEEEDEDFSRHFRSVVEQWGGETISGLGLGLLAVFGRGAGGERASQRALLVAQDLQPDAASRTPPPRIGISAGRVLLRPGAEIPHLTGDIPDIAKLLAWFALPAEVLVSEAVAGLAGTWFRFEPQEERTLPGLQGNHKIHRLAGVRNHARLDDQPLAGRERELGQLENWWRESAAGRPHAVVLRAPAGYGKTRLAAAFARLVTATGGHVRRIQCRLEHQHEPLAAVAAGFGTDGQETASRSALFAAIKTRLDEDAERQPTLLLIDDLHWSDRATLELLSQIGRELAGQRLMLVVTTRPETTADLPAERCETIELPPLDQTASLAMIAAHDPEMAIPTDERARIAASCAGIPLFIERQVKSRIEGSDSCLSITALLQGELDQLGADKTVLQTAALLGNRFRRSHLACLLPGADIGTALARALDRGLVDAESAGSYAFRHALIADAAYQCLPVGRRKRLHKTAARLFAAEADCPAEEVARHFTAAGSRDEAVAWWLKAGDAEMAREFAADAMVSFRQALELLESPDKAPDPALSRTARIRLGYAAQVAEGYGSPLTYGLFAEMTAEIEALPDPDPDQLFAALSGCYMGASSFGRDEGLKIARRLQALARTDAERLMALFSLGNTLFWLGRFDEAAHWQRQCIALAAQVPMAGRLRFGVDDPAVTARAFHGWTLWFLGDDAAACAMTEEAVSHARRGARAHGLCFVLVLAACLHWCRGDVAKVAALAGEALAVARQYRFPLWEGGASLLLLWAQASSGAMADSQALFAAAEMLQQAIPSRATTSRWIVLHGLLAREEWHEVEKLLDFTLREIVNQEEQYCLADLLRLKSRCLARRGLDDEAREYAVKARDLAAEQNAAGLSARFG